MPTSTTANDLVALVAHIIFVTSWPEQVIAPGPYTNPGVSECAARICADLGLDRRSSETVDWSEAVDVVRRRLDEAVTNDVIPDDARRPATWLMLEALGIEPSGPAEET